MHVHVRRRAEAYLLKSGKRCRADYSSASVEPRILEASLVHVASPELLNRVKLAKMTIIATDTLDHPWYPR